MTKILNDTNFSEVINEGITLVDFYADWCGPCQMVAPIIDELSSEVENSKVVKVNVDNSPLIASEYGIRSIPTFILFKDGEIIERIIGANGSKQYYLDLIDNAR